MKLMKFAAGVAGILLLMAQGASADDSTPLIGSWVDKLPNGYLMITDFSATTVAFHPVDPEGKGSPPTTIPVTYSKDKDGAIRLMPGGNLGEPLTVLIKDANTILLQFDGMDPRTLTRQKAAPPAHGQ